MGAGLRILGVDTQGDARRGGACPSGSRRGVDGASTGGTWAVGLYLGVPKGSRPGATARHAPLPMLSPCVQSKEGVCVTMGQRRGMSAWRPGLRG